jgi:hypothetical protein
MLGSAQGGRQLDSPALQAIGTLDEELEQQGSPAAPEALSAKVSWLVRQLDQLRSGVGEVPVDPSLLIPSQVPGVLSIIGDQGVGKSTTLKHVCDYALADKTRIVTPVVSPERFADGDTLFGWVLTAMNQIIKERIPDASRREVQFSQGSGTLRLSELASLLRRQEALARKIDRGSNVGLAAHPDEWAENIAAVTTAGQQLVLGWVTLLNALLEDITQIVIPIDDADQVPSILVPILRDLRWMTVHPAVSVVVCVNQDMLMQSLLGEEELLVMEPAARRRHAMGVLAKALPRHLRAKLDPLTLDERLAFVPPLENEPLIDILRRFRNPDAGPLEPKTIADLFQVSIGGMSTTTPYADSLPETPRHLDQLWRELREILRDPDHTASEKAANAARVIAERGVDLASEGIPGLPDNTMRFFESPDEHRLSVEFDFTELEARSAKGAGRTVRVMDRTRIAMRRIEESPMYLLQESGGETTRHRLPNSFANAHYFTLDSGSAEGTSMPLQLWGIVGDLGIPGGQAWSGSIEVFLDGAPTDHLFALVPVWDSRFDYYLYRAAWNLMWNRTQDPTVRSEPKLLDWIIMRHALLVAEIQRTRAISARLVQNIDSELRELRHWTPEADCEYFRQMATEVYVSSQEVPTRQLDFQGWFEHYLPWAADPVLGQLESAEALLQCREDVLAAEGALERADRGCIERLSSRIQRNLSADWVRFTIELLARFDPGLAKTLAGLHQVAGERKDSEMGALGEALEKRGVPRGAVGEMFVAGVNAEVERELRLAGFPDAAIETLSERFSPLAERVRSAPEADDLQRPRLR